MNKLPIRPTLSMPLRGRGKPRIPVCGSTSPGLSPENVQKFRDHIEALIVARTARTKK